LPPNAPPGRRLPPVEFGKLVVNELRSKLKSHRLAESTRDSLRRAIAKAETKIRELQGESRPQFRRSLPALPADASTVQLNPWAYGGNTHEEVRRFTSGDALLSYLEHRPAVLGLLAARPLSGKGVVSPRAQPTPEVWQRIRESQMVQAVPEADRPRVVAQLGAIWGWAESARVRQEARAAALAARRGGEGGAGGGTGGGFEGPAGLEPLGPPDGGDGGGAWEEGGDDGESMPGGAEGGAVDEDWWPDGWDFDDGVEVDFEVDFDSGGGGGKD
jgi:hypothetical protein